MHSGEQTRRPRTRIVLLLVALLLIATLAVARYQRSPLGSATPGTNPPRTAVIVHSYSGSTKTAGRAIADMFGARFTVYSDPPPELPPGVPNEHPFERLDLKAAADGAEHLYLGFPIWAGGPPALTQTALDRLDLRGRRVTLLYTYLHHVDPTKLAALRARVVAAGATLTPDVALLFPFSASVEDKVRMTQQAVWARQELWSEPETSPAAKDCHENARAGTALCRIPAGPVWLGDPDLGQPPRRVRVDAFDLSRAEITQGAYRACAREGKCPSLDLERSSCSILGIDDALPMPCVSMDAARAFCTWAGLRLPTEAEWMRAARGGGVTLYPWGNADPGSARVAYGNFGERPGAGLPEYELLPPDSSWPEDGFRDLAPPCSFPQGNSSFGICDLAGNLFEWVETPDSESRAGFAVVKGGSWMDADPKSFRVGARAEIYASQSFYLIGFRCAGDPAAH